MIVTLTGSNDFERKNQLDKLVSNFLIKHDAIGIERIDGEEVDYQTIYDAVTGLPFLVDKRLVILKNPSLNKTWLEKAENILDAVGEATDIILVEAKLDKRMAYYKYLKSHTDFRENNELDSGALVHWLIDYAISQGGSLNISDARFLISQLDNNQMLLRNEVDKLLLYDLSISKHSIELLVEPKPQSSIFDMIDALFNKDLERCLRLYQEQRILQVEPIAIIAMLAWQLNILALIKVAGERTQSQVAQSAKINPYVVNKSWAMTRKFKFQELKSLINKVLLLDKRLKSQSIDADEALSVFMLSVTGS